MRSKKVMYNLLASIVELVIVTVSSFIVPHYVIHAYGSGVNGLISSITQFLSYIALIESGIGAIGRANLYKPLADRDTIALSGAVNALENFYRKVSYIFLGYIALLAMLFPLLVNNEFEWAYTATLILILAFGTFIQYYFGITSQTVAQADQRKYISLLLHAVSVLLNMVVTIVLINLGAGIHTVKLCSAFVYAVRPMILYFYVRRHYRIDRTVKPRNEILRQRWDGLAQHIAFFIHKNTDIAVLTILTNVREVSVYSVYMLAVSGCSKIVNMFSASLEPAFGNMIAKGEKETLRDRVGLCTTLSLQVAVVLFTTAALVVSPFIRLYTRGVTDVNYLRPSFGVIMLIAEGFYCIRMPFQYAVYAAGHFRQTRNGAIMEAVLNIVISVVLASFCGLIGVAIGTLVSMAFRTIQYIFYYHDRLLEDHKGLKTEVRKGCIALLEIAAIIGVGMLLPEASSASYPAWILSSLVTGAASALIVLLFSLLFYRKECRALWAFVRRVGRKSR